jgi:hypothetical protein
MRTVAHWNLRYVYHCTRQMLYERGHGDDLWLTPAAIRLLESLLRPTDRGAEFGPGRSIIWFAERVAALISVEHDEQWYEAVSAKLKARQLSDMDYILARPDRVIELGVHGTYARTALGFPDAGLDSALVDGYYRDYTVNLYYPRFSWARCLLSTTSTGMCRQSRGRRIRGRAPLGRAEGSGRRWPENWLNGVFHQALSCRASNSAG